MWCFLGLQSLRAGACLSAIFSKGDLSVLEYFMGCEFCEGQGSQSGFALLPSPVE